MQSNILTVEDEQRVANLLHTGLTENGYNCLVAYDGIMGMKLFQSNEINLVISDVVLPGINVFEVCKLIITKFGRASCRGRV